MSPGTSLFLTNRDLLPLQRFYLAKYALAATHLRPTGNFTFAEVAEHNQLTLAVPQDVAEDNNRLVLSQAAASRGRGPLYFTPRLVITVYFYGLLRTYIYNGQSPTDLIDSSAHLSLNALILFGLAGIRWPNRFDVRPHAWRLTMNPPAPKTTPGGRGLVVR